MAKRPNKCWIASTATRPLTHLSYGEIEKDFYVHAWSQQMLRLLGKPSNILKIHPIFLSAFNPIPTVVGSPDIVAKGPSIDYATRNQQLFA